MKRSALRRIVPLIVILVIAFPQLVFAIDNLGKLENTVVLYLGSSKALVNNVEKTIDSSNSAIAPVAENGRTLVPVRFVSENMGMKVDWDNGTKGITITQGSDIIKMQIDNKNMSKNGVAFASDAAPCIKNDKTYVPLRVLSESFGKNVFFDRNLIIISEKSNVVDKTADKQFVDSLIQRYQIAKKLTVEEISNLDKSVVIVSNLDANGKVISQGSGFCVAPGIFATNYHVVERAAKLQIETDDGKKYEIEGITSADFLSDLVFVKTKVNPNLTVLKLGFDKQNTKGQQIVTIGSPEGLKNTVSEGIISGFRNNLGVELIQITAPITNGSSGSPLFDMYGDVIGINASGLDAGNLNFSVSINHIRDWYKRITNLPYASIPIIGKENYTKDAKLPDADIFNTLNLLNTAFNKESLTDYSSLFYYSSEAAKKADLDTIQMIFTQFDIEMKIENPRIIKKTTDETLVRASISYKDKKQGLLYRDNTIEGLFYLKKVGTQWKVYRLDSEKLSFN